MGLLEFLMGGNTCQCIFCGERIAKKEAAVCKKMAGVCQTCHSVLPLTPFGTVFPGRDALSGVIAPFYYSGPVREAMLRYKFQGCHAYGPVFADYIVTYLHILNEIEDNPDPPDSYGLMAPVPLSEKRIRERGYNQAGEAAMPVAAEFGIAYKPDLLRRVRHTGRQSGLRRFDRFSNVMGSFEVQDVVRGKKIYLVDDICTTSSTMEACARELMLQGAARVTGIAIAMTEKLEPKPAYWELAGG